MAEQKSGQMMGRRDFLKVSTVLFGFAVLGANFMSGCSGKAEKYPSGTIEVVVPTSEGGTTDQLARAHGQVWAELLGAKAFSYSFYPGAAGEVAYSLFAKKTADGYTLLFGNIEAEGVMYVLQKPDSFKIDDFIFMNTLSKDPAVILVRKDAPWPGLKELIEEGQKRKLNMGVSRWGSLDTVAGIILGKQTGANINVVPYGGGNKARVALLNGEIDFLMTKLAAALSIKDSVRFLAMVQDENPYPSLSDNCPPINKVLGTQVPEVASTRNWVVHKALKEKYPDRYQLLAKTAEEAFRSSKFQEALKKVGQPLELYTKYIGEEQTMKYLQQVLKTAAEYQDILKANK
ncbi:MAG: hypothetical protein PWP65_1660 [Clostridia bacterium]|nr:hypothetical protein [Clostridia bacterium]